MDSRLSIMDATLDLAFAPAINTMMGGWRNIVQDTRHLADVVMRLPDHCDCRSDGGRCDCCLLLERPFPEQCRTCAEHIADVSERLTLVLDDTLRYMAPTDEIASARRRSIHDLLRDVAIATIRQLRTLDELKSATGDFRHGCRTAHVHRIKHACERLTNAVERAHAEIRAL